VGDQLDADRDRVNTALQDCRPHEDMEGALLTGWVVVAEWTDREGKQWLSRFMDEHSSSWKVSGMLRHAIAGYEDSTWDPE
jgi:hypothetical protein